MSSQLDAIKARAEYVSNKSLEAMSCHLAEVDIPALVAAIAAVLELHEPEATGYGDWVCGACISAGSHDWESTAYPCPTVTAIQSALGEGQ